MNLNMRTAFVFTCLFFIVFMGHSQNPPNSSTWLEDSNGKMLLSGNYTDVDGNPYFPQKWVNGSITLKSGKKIAYNELRYNLITGNVEFNYAGKAYEVTNVMNEFKLDSMKFRNGFALTGKQNAETYYQVLYDGKQKLLCYRNANTYITQDYNSATKMKKLDMGEFYYLQKTDGKLYEIKRNLKSVLTLLDDKTKQTEAYCKQQNLKLKSWDDVIKVLEYTDNKLQE